MKPMLKNTESLYAGNPNEIPSDDYDTVAFKNKLPISVKITDNVFHFRILYAIIIHP
ncbi:MAG: hypothetical protein PHR39_06225 [Actinomycetota bacterium]|nr:hypothetical protein [Actinomycetota bacterium]